VQGQWNNRDGRQREAHDRAGADVGRDRFTQKPQRLAGGQQRGQGRWDSSQQPYSGQGNRTTYQHSSQHQPRDNLGAHSSCHSQSDIQYHQPYQQQHHDETCPAMLVVRFLCFISLYQLSSCLCGITFWFRHGRPQKFSHRGQRPHFANPFQVADNAMQMDVHNALPFPHHKENAQCYGNSCIQCFPSKKILH